MDLGNDASTSEEYVEVMQSDVLVSNLVNVFTPRGDTITLPSGATPIDFAYAVHTDIGHRCRGARVNGHLVPLDYTLKSGQQVEVLTAKRGGPSRDWLNPNLNLVKSARAKSKIRLWFKKQEDSKNLAEGREALERELQRLSVGDCNLDKLARSLGYKTPDKMFIHLGTGELSIPQVIKRFAEDEEKPSNDVLEANAAPTPPEKSSEAIEVVGLKSTLKIIAKCCSPMPGDPIIGYVTRGRGISVHRRDCPNILKLQDTERLAQVTWGHVEHTFPASIKIKAYDRQGLMSDVSILLSDENVNINNVSVNINRSMADLRLIIEVKDIPQLSRILTRIENLPNVIEAYRYKPG